MFTIETFLLSKIVCWWEVFAVETEVFAVERFLLLRGVYYQIRWLMKPERRIYLRKSLLDPFVLVVCVAPNRPSP